MPGLVHRAKSFSSPSPGPCYEVEPQDRRPSPRQHSPTSIARIQIKNRRKHYLDTHPEYFSSASHELADPLTYDRLIRRFQTAAEREAEGKRKGYSGVLEADLWRSEAKINALNDNGRQGNEMIYRHEANGEVVREEKDEVPASKEEGDERWRKLIEMRFLRGENADFDYSTVDGDDGLDVWEESRDIEDRWFEEEEESFMREGSNPSLEGETGVQDF
ncbi:MAG: hypothetical protein Q9218_004621 [Villophora microphyllina]